LLLVSIKLALNRCAPERRECTDYSIARPEWRFRGESLYQTPRAEGRPSFFCYYQGDGEITFQQNGLLSNSIALVP
jgi:hypothetical protein